jgi:hypothetical protein
MMSRPLIIELPAYGPSRGGSHPKTLRGPVGKERPAGPRSHTEMPPRPCVIPRLSSLGSAATSSCLFASSAERASEP